MRLRCRPLRCAESLFRSRSASSPCPRNHPHRRDSGSKLHPRLRTPVLALTDILTLALPLCPRGLLERGRGGGGGVGPDLCEAHGAFAGRGLPCFSALPFFSGSSSCIATPLPPGLLLTRHQSQGHTTPHHPPPPEPTRPPRPPPLQWAKFSSGQSNHKFSLAHSAPIVLRPQIFFDAFDASKNSAPPGGGGGGWQ